MGAESVSLTIAFVAGFLSFFSPCILPMIPVYIMYITGINVEEELDKKKIFALTRTLGFVLGFTIIFMIMGTSASFIGKIFIKNKGIFTKISGLVIFLFGLKMTGVINFNFLNREKKVKTPKTVTSWIGSVLLGMAFAAGWTPCFGPVLASILVYAGGSSTVGMGVYLLLAYSIGMALPFILTALFINQFNAFMKKTEKIMIYVPIISGIIMIIFGILVFFDKIKLISGLLI